MTGEYGDFYKHHATIKFLKYMDIIYLMESFLLT